MIVLVLVSIKVFTRMLQNPFQYKNGSLKVAYVDFWPEWDQENFLHPILERQFLNRNAADRSIEVHTQNMLHVVVVLIVVQYIVVVVCLTAAAENEYRRVRSRIHPF